MGNFTPVASKDTFSEATHQASGHNAAPTALVAPLDWGLGHATRCIPVIQALMDRGWNVLLAADRAPLMLLREAYPALPWIRLPGAVIRYPTKTPMLLALARQSPAFIRSVRKEQQQLRHLLQEQPLDLIISDNRYGLHHASVPSILITHQVSVRLPGFPGGGMLAQAAVKRLLAPFSSVWIPDAPGPDNLSGELADRYGLPRRAQFVGALSRFGVPGMAQGNLPAAWKPMFAGASFDAILQVSGPEPAAERFRQRLREQAMLSDRRLLLLEGRPEAEAGWQEEGRLTRCAHLPTAVLAHVLRQKPLVLCRSGYSTLMDLGAFPVKAALVPTPGQSEQEYLAKRCAEHGWATASAEAGLDLEQALQAAQGTSGLPDFQRPKRLQQALDLALET